MRNDLGWHHQDYSQKYQHFSYLLKSEEEIDRLTHEPGYSIAAGIRHKFALAIALQQLALEIEEDFNELFELARYAAVQDETLARQLVEAEILAGAVARRIRLRGVMTCLLPSPRPGKVFQRFRRLFACLMPRDNGIVQLIEKMSAIQKVLTM